MEASPVLGSTQESRVFNRIRGFGEAYRRRRTDTLASLCGRKGQLSCSYSGSSINKDRKSCRQPSLVPESLYILIGTGHFRPKSDVCAGILNRVTESGWRKRLCEVV